MVDAFESSDLQKLQNALNEANAESNKQEIKKAQIEKKDDEYNDINKWYNWLTVIS